jgi:hypothetical protein
VASGVEASPGVKDPGKLREFIGAAHAAAREVSASSGSGPGKEGGSQPGAAAELFDWQDEE